MDLANIDNPPEFDLPPIDQYENSVMPDDDDFHMSSFDIGVIEPEIEAHKTPMPAPRIEYKRKPKQELVASHEEVQPFVQIPESLMDSVIGRLSSRVSECLEFPEASTFMSLLASASAAVATSYAVQYKSGTSVAAGLYVIVEQLPATQKSYLLGIGMDAYSMCIGEHNKKIFAKNREKKERKIEDNMMLPAFSVTTDATSAALDKNLAVCSEGRFVIASAEQSALISLFPESSSFASTNELILKGYPGEYVSGMRGSREAFNGVAQGVIVLIAQPGSSRRVLAASNGSGMAERFFFLSEPAMIGSRQLLGNYVSNHEKSEYEKAVKKCVDIYTSKIFSVQNMEEKTRVMLDPKNLIQIKASNNGYLMILQARRDMEEYLGELGSDGDMVMLSWLGKFETHVLKIALTMHVFECLGNDCKVPDIIPDKFIASAMDMVMVLADHLKEMLHSSGESGFMAEEDAVIEVTLKGGMNRRQITLLLKNRKPFKAMGRGAYKAACSRVDAMIKSGSLIIDAKGNIVSV